MMSRAQHTGGGAQPLPDGVFPTMITPFLNDGDKSVDWAGLDRMSNAADSCKIVYYVLFLLC